VADLPALCAAGRHARAIVGVDNTFATPLLQQPLALGADVAVHSATKFIGGHSDLLSGITIARDQALAERLRHRRGLTGATPGALEAFLALRACALLPCASIAASATPANSPAGSMSTLPSAACATPVFPPTPDTAQPPRR
jgi:cystathionine gamma-synthase